MTRNLRDYILKEVEYPDPPPHSRGLHVLYSDKTLKRHYTDTNYLGRLDLSILLGSRYLYSVFIFLCRTGMLRREVTDAFHVSADRNRKIKHKNNIITLPIILLLLL